MISHNKVNFQVRILTLDFFTQFDKVMHEHQFAMWFSVANTAIRKFFRHRPKEEFVYRCYLLKIPHNTRDLSYDGFAFAFGAAPFFGLILLSLTP